MKSYTKNSGDPLRPCSPRPTWTEAERLAALDCYAILDTGREPAFDDVATLAADILDAPIAVVNLIAADRQWFKAEVGIGADTLPLDVSICRHAILQPGVFVVPDLSKDARFDGNPLVHVKDGLRFYAGALLETPEGLPLGTVCVLDTKARPGGVSERQERALKVLANQTMAQLELRRSEVLARKERALTEEHGRRLSLLSEASSMLLASSDLATSLKDLFGLVADKMGVDFAFHYRCGEGALQLVAAAALTPEQEQAAARIEFGQTVCGIVAATREAVCYTGIQGSDDPHVQIAKTLGIESYFSLPLLSGSDLLGTVSFGRKHGTFSPGELEALGTLASQLATAIERQQVEADLRVSEAQLRFVLKAGRLGAWSLDLASGEMTTSESCRANFGRDPEADFSYEDLRAAVHPDDRERMAAAVEQSLATGADYDIEYRAVTPEGSVRWVAIRARPAYAADGAPTGMSGVSLDITDRRAAEDRLRESDARYRTLFEAVDAGFCVIELKFDASGCAVDYRHVEANPAFERQTGLKDHLGLWMSDAIPDLERHWFDIYGEVSRSGQAVRFENRAEPLNRWFDVHAFRTGTPEDGLVAVLFNDITERKRAEYELRFLNETLEAQVFDRTAELRRFRDIVEATTSPICAFDADYRLIAFNKAHNDEFRRVNGFDTKLGDVFPDLFISEQQSVMRALMARALSGEAFTVTEAFGRPELGQPQWEIHYTPLRDESGAVIGAFHLATDISDRLRAEAELASAQEALRQSQKMEAMGQLTGGVAHDFNNLLTPIVGALDLLQRRGLGGDREHRLITGAMQSAERAKVLVQRLLAFARRQPLQPAAVDVGRLVSDMADLVASTTGPQIKVTVDIPQDLPPVIADANQLEMALLNVSVNARDAMPDGGALRISAESAIVRTGQEPGLNAGGYVKLSVADNGVGMDEATLARAIEPFFSTKGIGKGTGLGLSMVHGLASQLGGAMRVHSRLGLGTNIELWLPQSSVAAAEPEGLEPAEAASAARGKALLVDDEELVRISTADMLSDLGYNVTEAASAEEALRLFDNGLRADLLVTDHLMPGMNGTELARIFKARAADLPVLIVSGYAESEGIAPDLPRLTKPFRSDELAAALASMVAGK